MKKSLSLFLLFFSSLSFAQPAVTDSVARKKVDELEKTIQLMKQEKAEAAKAVADASVAKTESGICGTCKKLSVQQKLMVLSPIIIGVLFTLYCIRTLSKEGFKLSDALTESKPVARTVEKPADAATATPAHMVTEVDFFPKSTSRLIAFFSGLAAITIAISTVSYFFYIYFRTGTVPDMEKLFNIILALGIGITPYAFNKVSKAINPNA